MSFTIEFFNKQFKKDGEISGLNTGQVLLQMENAKGRGSHLRIFTKEGRRVLPSEFTEIFTKPRTLYITTNLKEVRTSPNCWQISLCGTLFSIVDPVTNTIIGVGDRIACEDFIDMKVSDDEEDGFNRDGLQKLEKKMRLSAFGFRN